MADAIGQAGPDETTHTIRHIPSNDSLQKTPPLNAQPDGPVFHHPTVTLQDTPASPVHIHPPHHGLSEAETASVRNVSAAHNIPRIPSVSLEPMSDSIASLSLNDDRPLPALPAETDLEQSRASLGRVSHEQDAIAGENEVATEQSLHYHGFEDLKKRKQVVSQNVARDSVASSASSGSDRHASQGRLVPGARVPSAGLQRPMSTYTLGADLRGRTLSPFSANGSEPGSPGLYARDRSAARRSPGARPMSYVDLLNNVPYNQQQAPSGALSNAGLQSVVGNAASLLDTKKTLDMYRANVKKTMDAPIQYEFAIFMVNIARETRPGDGMDAAELITEAKHILQRLSDRAYPFAQYYLADGYFSGLFNRNKPDYEKAFPLFVAASKHGHAESGYRAALCHEFGWGCAKSYPKAVQYYRTAASKNHPGAATRLGMACLKGDMGLGRSGQVQREGIRWLKRAQESADFQYNSAPFELGIMHLEGFGEEIFKDEAYAAQLLTQAAELAHPQANFLMGQAYENGLYGCPRDAALSVHFYNGAATRDHPEAMMALCAWYMVGAEPMLEKDEGEAYAWAKQAAESGLAKAQYAVGYFTEMGIGCRRDPLEANVWYVRAADQGNDMATQRLQIIRAAAAGDTGVPMERAQARTKELANGHSEVKESKKKRLGIF